jgi:hypothetical protein
MPTIVNVKKKELNKKKYEDFGAWSTKSNNLYIGRNMDFYVKGAKGSKWANPFSTKKFTREECLQKYEEYIRTTPSLFNALHELCDKELGCWCKPESCHGDVLIALYNEKYGAN